MRLCAVIGGPNTGKTLFTINFVEYLGCRRLNVVTGGTRARTSLTPQAARRSLVSPREFSTRALMQLEIRLGRATRLTLVDTVAISDVVHPDISLRRVMAETIDVIRRAHVILHVVDSEAVTADNEGGLQPIDRAIATYASTRKGYVILVNKIDAQAGRTAFVRVKQAYAGLPVFAISALRRRGFKEVRAFLNRC